MKKMPALDVTACTFCDEKLDPKAVFFELHVGADENRDLIFILRPVVRARPVSPKAVAVFGSHECAGLGIENATALYLENIGVQMLEPRQAQTQSGKPN